MDTSEHLRHLRQSTAAMAELARTDLTAAVPSCPGWDLGTLVLHSGGAMIWWRMQIERHASVRQREVELPPEGTDLAEWFAQNAASTIAALEALDPDEPRPSRFGDVPGRYFPRRLAHELSIHLWDAQGTVGTPTPIDTTLAADGIDEFCEVLAPRLRSSMLTTAGTIHLHATDGDLPDDTGEWLLRLDPTRGDEPGITFERGHAKGDVAVRGSAADLVLLVWNRVALDDRFQVFGSEDLLTAWRTDVHL